MITINTTQTILIVLKSQNLVPLAKEKKEQPKNNNPKKPNKNIKWHDMKIKLDIIFWAFLKSKLVLYHTHCEQLEDSYHLLQGRTPVKRE